MKQIEFDINMNSFIRYFLNDIDNESKIEKGVKFLIRNNYDYKKNYELYNENSFETISRYIISLFTNNNKTLNQYNKIKIIYNEYRGIFCFHANIMKWKHLL